MKLYFVRHGKTLWNLEGRFQGANGDSPLLESSKDDLRQLARELWDISFDAIYSSDLKELLILLALLWTKLTARLILVIPSS